MLARSVLWAAEGYGIICNRPPEPFRLCLLILQHPSSPSLMDECARDYLLRSSQVLPWLPTRVSEAAIPPQNSCSSADGEVASCYRAYVAAAVIESRRMATVRGDEEAIVR